MSRLPDDWPLVPFSTLAIAGAGLVSAGVVEGPATAVLAGAALVAAGLGVSLMHLGRPWRAGLAAARVGRSPLSTEVAAGVATVVCAVAAVGFAANPPLATLFRVLAGAAAVALLLSTGLVYRLGGQLTWCGVVTLGPLLAGFAVGALAVYPAAAAQRRLAIVPVLALLGLDAAAALLRWRDLDRLDAPCEPAWPVLFARRHEILLLRVLVFNACAAALVTVGLAVPALAAGALGLLVDRGAFYGLAARHTTEAELASVERVIEATPTPGP